MREKRKYIVVLAIYRMKSYGLACNFFFIEYLGLFIFFFKTIKIVLTFIGLSIRVLFSFVSLNLKMTQLISGYTSLFLFLVFYEFRRMIRFFQLLIFYLFKGFFFWIWFLIDFVKFQQERVTDFKSLSLLTEWIKKDYYIDFIRFVF